MKKLTVLLAFILTCSLFMGCSGTTNPTFNGAYWLENPINPEVENGFYERVEYDVHSIEEAGDFAPALGEINADYLDFVVDSTKSSYVTEIEGKDGVFVYRTKLVIYGTYIYGQKNTESGTSEADPQETKKGSYYVDGDYTETETTFKGLKDDFICIKSIKKVKNTYPKEQTPTSESDFVTVTAESTIDYSEKKATLTVVPKDEISKVHLTSIDKPVTIKNYNKKAYIDNELMLLIFRAFQYDNSFSYTFSTIESASGLMTGVVGSANVIRSVAQSSEDTLTANQTIEVKCTIDGSIKNREFNTFGVAFKTTGEFAQTFAYVYYAKSIGGTEDSQNDSRHYMVKCYRPMIYNTGYLAYTMKTVSHTK